MVNAQNPLCVPSEGRTCPWCEGRKVVGQLAHGEEPDSVTVLGVKIQVIGTMLEKRCGFCEGKGWIPKSQSQVERWAEIRAKREAKTAGKKK